MSRNAAKRLLRELDAWRTERKDEKGIERLGPVSEDDLLTWEAVVNGRGVGHGYDDGRWLLRISIPTTYPLQPPSIKFATQIIHPNIALKDGEICLDLLRTAGSEAQGASAAAWSPAYSVLECVRAVRMLLAYPDVDSPLNVDVAAMLRDGDKVGARRLVELWCESERFEGE